ncbi:metallophosphoesterase family protein [Desulfosudis oleivorans]|uniref:Metallophosphoesterase n=1 Tax=Desulfosudis oleivorans (strain DSM 6200 / JCM 39069 / Hxd3) TaxID=96561 RepID=A9A0S2_DESOH|nr:metallophosphoesterase [Desulfosudis oleivorans]ABW67547.1 metallophosphoesterase [Desulfosudis oleivorans Hxd3]
MRIYAVADIHGRSHRFDMIRRRVADLNADLLVVAGDVAGWFSANRSMEELSRMPVPVLAVRGNSDGRRMEQTVFHRKNISWLHLNRMNVEGLVFSGISGTFLLPFDSRLCLAEQRMVAGVGNQFTGVSVLVAHPPPRGVLDRVFGRWHAGSAGLRQIITENRIPLVICGHLHEMPGVARLEETLVVNCSIGGKGQGALIQYEPGMSPQVEMLPV